jgi:hypothetical protein
MKNHFAVRLHGADSWDMVKTGGYIEGVRRPVLDSTTSPSFLSLCAVSLSSNDLMDYIPILRPPARLRDKVAVMPTRGWTSEQAAVTDKQE